MTVIDPGLYYNRSTVFTTGHRDVKSIRRRRSKRFILIPLPIVEGVHLTTTYSSGVIAQAVHHLLVVSGLVLSNAEVAEPSVRHLTCTERSRGKARGELMVGPLGPVANEPGH